MELRVGTSGFADPPGRGRAHPEDLADDDMLGHVAALRPAAAEAPTTPAPAEAP